MSRLWSNSSALRAMAAALVATALAPAGPASAQIPQAITRASLSQQFIITGVPVLQPPLIRPNPQANLVQLEPDTAAISCERIKRALLKELGAEDQWRGKIYLRLQSRRNDDFRVVVQGGDYKNGGVYWVDMPDLLPRRKFLDAMTSVLLMEMACRGAGEIPAELPPWLTDGMSARLEAEGILQLIAEPFSQQSTLHNPVRSIEQLREHFRNRPALSLDQLNWPGTLNDAGEIVHYRNSAHLLVHELLRLDRGRWMLQGMLGQLRHHLNWQMAFLKAFGSQFPNLPALSKWWSLTSAHFQGRDPGRDDARADVLQQLSAILSVPLDVQVGGTRVGSAAKASLQQVIEEWEPSQLDPMVARKIAQLDALQLRSGPVHADLVIAYRDTLKEFQVQKGAAGGSTASRLQLLPNAKLVQKRLVEKLNALDRKRTQADAEEAALNQSRRPAP